jgi:hypothetical protein
MTKYNIYFQDLKEEVQDELWALLSKRLLDDGLIKQEQDETEDAFLMRLWEETEHYINTHNFANKYKL